MSSNKKTLLIVTAVLLSTAGSCAGCIALAARPGGFSFSADGNGVQMGKVAVKKPRIALRRDPLTNEPTDFTQGPLKVGQRFICTSTVDADGKPLVASLLGTEPLTVLKDFPLTSATRGEHVVTLDAALKEPGRYGCRVANGEVSETTFFEVK